MIFFDGTYRLQRDIDTPPTSIGRWAYAWRVRIIDLTISRSQVAHLRPFIVFITQAGEGIFKASCAESIGKKVCRDFDLDLNETLWLELLPGSSEHIHVARFIPKGHYGPEAFYTIEWRPIRPNELETLKDFIPETENYSIPKPEISET